MSKKAFFAAIIVSVIVAAAARTAFINNQSQADELYRQSIEQITKTEGEPYSLTEIESEQNQFRGESKGDAKAKNIRQQGEIKVKTDTIAMNVSLIAITADNKTDNYLRYNSVEALGPKNAVEVETLFKPLVGKWSKSTSDVDDFRTPSFEDQGVLATTSITGIYLPLTNLSDEDHKKYFEVVDDIKPFEVDKKIVKTKFKDYDARQLTVSIQKDKLIQFGDELERVLSKDAGLIKAEPDFIDQYYGGKDTFTVKVYLQPDSAKLMGIELDINMSEPVEDLTFSTSFKKIRSSSLVLYDRPLDVQPPKDVVSDADREAIINQPL